MYNYLLKHAFFVCCLFLSIGFFTNCSDDDDSNVSIYNLQLEGADYLLLTKGNATTIKLKIIPIHTTNKTINWKSNNDQVATVENGVITAVEVGNALITATSNSNPEKKVEIRVRVNPISVEKIELSVVSPVTMNPNDVLQITAMVLPETAPQELLWKSTDETIATVSVEGEVTAFQPGEVIISAISISDETKAASVRITVAGLEEVILDNAKFVALSHSSQFQFSPWGTSDLSVLWNNNTVSLGTPDIFYISNKIATYFGVDLGVKARLTSMRYWGRNDNYFMLRHPKTIMIYGTNDASVANNPESPDEDWILLTEVPFESVRPSEGTDKPVVGDADYLYASEGEKFSFLSNVPAVRYIRFKCLKTWGNVEGFWSTEIAFWGEIVE